MKRKEKSYAELLRDPRWQKKRLEIMHRDNFTCQHCGCQDKELQVHHLWYSPIKKPWEYDNNSFLTLCSHCHELETEYNSLLYSSFCDLKTICGQNGISKQLLEAVFYRIASIFIGGFESIDSIGESVKNLFFDAACGTQIYSDAKALEKLGIDMSLYYKNVEHKLLDDYETR